MNLQIVSNTILEGRANKTNDFEMKLIQTIDALNNAALLKFWKYVIHQQLQMLVTKIVGLFNKYFMRISRKQLMV